MRDIIIITLSFALLAFTSCRKPRKGALSEQKKTELQILAESSAGPEEKFHQIGEHIAQLLSEALVMNTDSAMLAQMSEFNTENKDALTSATSEIDAWLKTIDNEEKTFFLIRMLSKPYTKSLQKYDARFRKRMGKKHGYIEHYEQLLRPLTIRN